MKYRRGCSKWVVCVFLFLSVGALAADYDPQDVLDCVLAYEALFNQYRMEYTAYSVETDDAGGLVPDGPIRRNVEWLEGHKFRQEEQVYDNGSRKTTVRVFDGEVSSVWFTSDTDTVGQAAILPAGGDRLLRRLTQFLSCGTRKDKRNTSKVKIVSQECNTVTVHITSGKRTGYYEVTFQKWGEYLRPLRRQAHYSPKGEDTQHGIEYVFDYGKDAHGDDILFPTKIEVIFAAYNLHSIYAIEAVDFSPAFPDGLFEHKFEDGTLIIDKTTGIKKRQDRAGGPLSEIDE